MDLTYLEFRAKVAVNNYRNGVCRFCLISVPHMNSYTANELRNSKIPSIFKLLTDFEMNMTDEHPTSICDACVKEMEAAVHIREQFQNIEQYWRQYLNEISLDGGPLEMKTEPIDILSSPSITINDSGKSLITIAPDSKSNDLVTLRDPIQQSSNYLFNETMCSTNITEVTLSGCNIDQLEDENEEVETKPKYRHCCGICGVLFKRKTELNKHMKVHGKRVHEDSTDEDEDDEQKSSAKKSKKQMKANCNECGEKFTNKRSLVQHLHNHVNRYCDICKIDFPTISARQTHRKTCVQTVSNNHNSCKFCEKVYKNIKQLFQHQRAKHLRQSQVECYLCKKPFRYLGRLRAHMNRDHNKSKKCSICDLELETYRERLSHEAYHTTLANVLCHLCGVIIKHGNFKRHLATTHAPGHTGRMYRLPDSALKPMKCAFCEQCFKFKKQLNRHMETKHPHDYKAVQKVYCNICYQQFQNSMCLKDHKLIHKRHECTVCKQKFISLQTLELHSRQHSKKDRPFKCSVCDATFTIESHVKFHFLRKHTRERPHKCDVCHKAFVQMYELRSHMNVVHKKLRPYQCSFCPRTFAVSNAFKYHEATHSGAFRYTCVKCNKGFHSSSALGTHNARVHH